MHLATSALVMSVTRRLPSAGKCSPRISARSSAAERGRLFGKCSSIVARGQIENGRRFLALPALAAGAVAFRQRVAAFAHHELEPGRLIARLVGGQLGARRDRDQALGAGDRRRIDQAPGAATGGGDLDGEAAQLGSRGISWCPWPAAGRP